MSKYFILLFFFFQILDNVKAETVILPIKVTGRVLSTKEKVLNKLEKDLYQINLTNSFDRDIFILGKADKCKFLYKIKKNSQRVFKFFSKEKVDLYYILNNKTYRFETYEDFYKNN